MPPPNAMVITVLPVAPNAAAIVHLLLRPPRKFIGLKKNDTDMLSHSKIVLLCDQKPQNQQLVDKLVSRCHFCAQMLSIVSVKIKAAIFDSYSSGRLGRERNFNQGRWAMVKRKERGGEGGRDSIEK